MPCRCAGALCLFLGRCDVVLAGQVVWVLSRMLTCCDANGMNIIHLNSYYKTNLIHREFVSALAKLGVQQDVFVPVEKELGGAEWMVDDVDGAKIFYVPCFRAWHRYVWPYKMWMVWRAFFSFVKDRKFNLVHAHTVVSNGLLAFFIRRFFQAPYVVTVRNTDTDFFFRKSFFFRWIGKLVLRDASAIIALTPVYIDRQLPRYFSGDFLDEVLKKVHVIPSAVSEDWHIESSARRTGASGRVAFVGRVDRNKNLRLLIEAVRILNSKGTEIELHVIGDGDDRPVCESLAKGLKAKFYGRISDNEVLRTVLAACDLLAVPSFRETFGLVYVEAMSQGLPVIYTAGQGFDGVFKEGYVGYAVDPTSSDDLAGKIELIYKNYEELSANAANASKCYSWDLVSEKVYGLYSDINR